LQLLENDGYTVITARNGEFALEASRSHPGPVDLLLTDIEMARMNGLELSGKIRVERPGIKILVMSGAIQASEHVSIDGLPFLSKPFTLAALRHSIEELLRPVQA
jgi:DNA-binding NtrC family response regulator